MSTGRRFTTKQSRAGRWSIWDTKENYYADNYYLSVDNFRQRGIPVLVTYPDEETATRAAEGFNRHGLNGVV